MSCSTTSTLLPMSRALERADQPVVVALVQADAGLVEHSITPVRPEPICRPAGCALRLGVSASGARLRSKVQTHVVEELQPQADFAHTTLAAISAFAPCIVKVQRSGSRAGCNG
jgi:hypothetical protein